MDDDLQHKQQLQVARDNASAVVQAGKEFFSNDTEKILTDKKTLNDHWAEFERFFSDYMTGDEHTVSMKRRLQSEVSARTSLLDRREGMQRWGLDLYAGLEQTVNSAFDAAAHAYDNRSQALRERYQGLLVEYYTVASDGLSLCSCIVAPCKKGVHLAERELSLWQNRHSRAKAVHDRVQIEYTNTAIVRQQSHAEMLRSISRQQIDRSLRISGSEYTSCMSILEKEFSLSMLSKHGDIPGALEENLLRMQQEFKNEIDLHALARLDGVKIPGAASPVRPPPKSNSMALIKEWEKKIFVGLEYSMEALEHNAHEVGMDKYIGDLTEVASSMPQLFKEYADGDR
jgi:hypothetical protein